MNALTVANEVMRKGFHVLDERIGSKADARYARYGIVVRSNPDLNAIRLVPPESVVMPLTLWTVAQLRESLQSARRTDRDATGRFFRLADTQTVFITDAENEFRVLDMNTSALSILAEPQMRVMIHQAREQGGFRPLMPGRMPI